MSKTVIPFPGASAETGTGQGAEKCPICGKAQQADYRPFCSGRCKQVDLGRWLGERYRIPLSEGPEPADFEENEE